MSRCAAGRRSAPPAAPLRLVLILKGPRLSPPSLRRPPGSGHQAGSRPASAGAGRGRAGPRGRRGGSEDPPPGDGGADRSAGRCWMAILLKDGLGWGRNQLRPGASYQRSFGVNPDCPWRAFDRAVPATFSGSRSFCRTAGGLTRPGAGHSWLVTFGGRGEGGEQGACDEPGCVVSVDAADSDILGRGVHEAVSGGQPVPWQVAWKGSGRGRRGCARPGARPRLAARQAGSWWPGSRSHAGITHAVVLDCHRTRKP